MSEDQNKKCDVGEEIDEYLQGTICEAPEDEFKNENIPAPDDARDYDVTDEASDKL